MLYNKMPNILEFVFDRSFTICLPIRLFNIHFSRIKLLAENIAPLIFGATVFFLIFTLLAFISFLRKTTFYSL